MQKGTEENLKWKNNSTQKDARCFFDRQRNNNLKVLCVFITKRSKKHHGREQRKQYLVYATVNSLISQTVNFKWDVMDEPMKQFQQGLIEVELEAENLLLARHEMVEIDRVRNGNREALTALRKRARTTKTSVPLPFESIMRDIDSRPLVKEVCATCGDHDSREKTLLMFPGTDVFASIPFHAAHTILEKDQARLDFDSKKLQSYVKEKSFLISEKGALADKIGPGVLRSLVTLSDKPKIEEKD